MTKLLFLTHDSPDSDDWSHCPQCTGSKAVHKGDGDFECADCLSEWSGNYCHYDHEPELNNER